MLHCKLSSIRNKKESSPKGLKSISIHFNSSRYIFSQTGLNRDVHCSIVFICNVNLSKALCSLKCQIRFCRGKKKSTDKNVLKPSILHAELNYFHVPPQYLISIGKVPESRKARFKITQARWFLIFIQPL